MVDLTEALAEYRDAPVVIDGRGAIGAREIVRRADDVSRDAQPAHAQTLRPASDHPADVLAALIAGARDSRAILVGEAGAFAMSALSGRFEVLLTTSGTTGPPKVVRHELDSLAERIRASPSADRWLLTYRTTAFAGLQVLLTAVLTRSTLIVPPARSASAFFNSAVEHAVTHVSGTPTMWRGWLLAASASSAQPPLRQITIGGEAVDQATLDRLSKTYPSARVTHIYASSEAGALFAVNDGFSGFPSSWLESGVDGVGLRIQAGELQVKSPRRMAGYATSEISPFTDDGWMRTGDLVTVESDRVIFCGRGDRMVNVAGHKVAPERVERVLLDVPGVLDAHAYGLASAVTGNVLVADIVCERGAEPQQVVAAATSHARKMLPKHEVPARILIVGSIAVADSGKKART